MTCVEIHGHIGKVELLDGIVGALKVGRLGTSTLGHVQVRDHVCERVGL